jgi:hypothetical protein
VEQIIGITRSQLRQVIEDYIAASRVGDTLSYVETAKLSAAEAAESSTSRIWVGLCQQEPVVHEPNVAQVLFALERQADALKKHCVELATAGDYGSELLAEDAEALERARRMLIESLGTVSLGEPPADNFAEAELVTEFTCAEDLAAGQVVVVNSRGMIEGKRDEHDRTVRSDVVLSYTFGFFQAEQLLGEFGGDTDAKVAVEFGPDGKAFACNLQSKADPFELTDTVEGEPEPTAPEDNASLFT